MSRHQHATLRGMNKDNTGIGDSISSKSPKKWTRRVDMVCKTCGTSKSVVTEDFRMNWECEKCKDLPVLMRIIGSRINNRTSYSDLRR